MMEIKVRFGSLCTCEDDGFPGKLLREMRNAIKRIGRELKFQLENMACLVTLHTIETGFLSDHSVI